MRAWLIIVSGWLSTGCALSPGGAPAVPAGACEGLSDAAIARGVSDLRANVYAVEPVLESEGPKAVPHTVGVRVEAHATLGATAEWMSRILACDAARRPTCSPNEDCPLTPPGASRTVAATPTGFAITLRSRDLEVAHEIARRTSELDRAGTR